MDNKFSFNTEKSIEDREVLMKKQILQTGVDESGNRKFVKIDKLKTNKEFITDIETELNKDKEKNKVESDLPLFRFEDKYKPLCIDYMTQIVTKCREIRKNNQDKYKILQPFLFIDEPKDIEHKLNLEIMRNKTDLNNKDNTLKIEIITCFYEKKLRVKYNIPEEAITDDNKLYNKYNEEVTNILKSFKELYQEIVNNITSIPNSTLRIIDSVGTEDYGIGISIIFEFIKKIDYNNTRKEISSEELFLDEMTDNEKEQFNILKQKKLLLSVEAGDDTSEEEDMLDDAESTEDDSGNIEDDGDNMSEDGGEDDMGFGGDEEGSNDENDNEFGGGNDNNESEEKNELEHPFADINSKSKAAVEIRELLNQINKTLEAIESLNINSVVVKKLVDFKAIVTDALKIAYIQPIEQSLIRYSMYVKQFKNLVNELKTEVLKNKEKTKHAEEALDIFSFTTKVL
jgi:hypothetical protein